MLRKLLVTLVVMHSEAHAWLLMQDPYIGGAQRIVTFQQAFDLKPWGNTGTYHYSERSTILDSQVLQPPPFRAKLLVTNGTGHMNTRITTPVTRRRSHLTASQRLRCQLLPKGAQLCYIIRIL